MLPVLFRFPDAIPLLGGKAINSFGLLVSLGFIAATFLLQYGMDRKGLDGEKSWNILILAFVGGIVGAKLYWAFSHPAALAADPMGTLFSGGGLTWFGGFVLATLLVILGIRKMGLPMGETLDAAALGLPVGIALGRIGCFLAGDDWGLPTHSPPGVRFPEGAPPTTVDVLRDQYGITVDPALVAEYGDVIPVHPTQLYEVVLQLLVFAVVFRLKDNDHRPGWLFSLWLVLYGIVRFLIEIVRVKEDRVLFGTLSVAQLISLGLIALGLWGMSRLRGDGGASPKPKESAAA